MNVLFPVLLLAACASATEEVTKAFGYIDRVAIPLAKELKEAEDKIHETVNRNARIVGGAPAKPNAHPYMAGLIATYVNRPNIGVCGGVLISDRRLMTAAHCWYDGVVQTLRFVVTLGSPFLFSGGTRTKSYSVVTYPGWNPISQTNNLAVIILKLPVILSPTIQPVPLATNQNETFDGQWAVASGFGFTSDSQTSIPVLTVVHDVMLEVIPNDVCRTFFGAIVQNNTLCTSGAGGVGTCRGDGGGPLVTLGPSPKLIGIINFGASSGCEAALPSGYARISSFWPFISKFL